MNKKVMAIAVAGVCAVPGVALAQKSTVEIYGRANIGFDNYQAKGSSIAGQDRDGRFRVFENLSRVGLRGTEDLGGGLRAIFQIETGVNLDTGDRITESGAVDGSGGFWASRDSFAGLDSNFGRLTFGRQSIYWANGVNAQFLANYINVEVPWTNGTGLGRISVRNAATGVGPVFRQSNTVQYTTPTFGGVNATFSYSPDVQEALPQAGAQADGQIFGITFRGVFGPFYGQIDYANSEANTPAVGPTHEMSFWKVGGSWAYIPGARIGAIWVRTENNNLLTAAAAGTDVDQDGWVINWEHTFGNVQLLGQYGQLGSLKGCTIAGSTAGVGCGNTKADAFMVGARYFLSKRTWVYVSYNQVDNEQNNFADFGAGQSSTNTAGGNTPIGADPRIWALGFFHAF